jgi:hypothetical protein
VFAFVFEGWRLGLISSRKLLTEKAIISKQTRAPGLTASLTEPMMEVSSCTGQIPGKNQLSPAVNSFWHEWGKGPQANLQSSIGAAKNKRFSSLLL